RGRFARQQTARVRNGSRGPRRQELSNLGRYTKRTFLLFLRERLTTGARPERNHITGPRVRSRFVRSPLRPATIPLRPVRVEGRLTRQRVTSSAPNSLGVVADGHR